MLPGVFLICSANIPKSARKRLIAMRFDFGTSIA
jgi:hypothetical protein